MEKILRPVLAILSNYLGQKIIALATFVNFYGPPNNTTDSYRRWDLKSWAIIYAHKVLAQDWAVVDSKINQDLFLFSCWEGVRRPGRVDRASSTGSRFQVQITLDIQKTASLV